MDHLIEESVGALLCALIGACAERFHVVMQSWCTKNHILAEAGLGNLHGDNAEEVEHGP